MSLRRKEYICRLIDKKINEYLSEFGAVLITGPKGCGKTWSTQELASSALYLDEDEDWQRTNDHFDIILNNTKPELVDEWNLFPKIWNLVVFKCTNNFNGKGLYLLTSSIGLTDEEQKNNVREPNSKMIGKIKMHTMSLYESGDSSGQVSIMDISNNLFESLSDKPVSQEKIADLIIRGGWPGNLSHKEDKLDDFSKNYIKSILDNNINNGKGRNIIKMRNLLTSLALDEGCIVDNQALLKEMQGYGDKGIDNADDLDDYVDLLDRLHIIENQKPYAQNYKFPEDVEKNAKRYFTDPSLTCAILDLTKDKLIDDKEMFGIMFEALVQRDLKIYMEYLNGNLYYFKDNVRNLEVDSILDFGNGEYVAVKIELENSNIEKAKQDLLKFSDNVIKKPKFMCIIVGNVDVAIQDSETGIYIFSITQLKP